MTYEFEWNVKTRIKATELFFDDFVITEESRKVEVTPDGILIYAPFESFGAIQAALEEQNIEILSSGFERIPQVTKKLNAEQMEEVEKLLEKLEEDDDVQNVYHTMQETED